MSAFVNVVRAELYKAVRKRRFYIVFGLQWLLLPVLVLLIGWLLIANVSGTFADTGAEVAMIVQEIASPFGMARVSLVLPALLAPPFLIIVIALIAALFMGEERSQNMWKTVVTAQPNRFAVLFGKLAAAMIVLAVFLIGALVASVLFGAVGMLFLPTDFSGDWGSVIGLYGLQWVFAISGMLFAFLMVWLIRSIPFGIVAIFFLPPLFEGLYSIYRATVGFDRLNRFNAFLQAIELQQTLQNLPRYFFTNNLYGPSREPLGEIARAFGGDTSGVDGPLANILGFNFDITRSLITMGVYALIFGVILTWSFVRRDID